MEMNSLIIRSYLNIYYLNECNDVLKFKWKVLIDIINCLFIRVSVIEREVDLLFLGIFVFLSRDKVVGFDFVGN